MKPSFVVALILLAGLTGWSGSAAALSPADIAGTYTGSVTDTYWNGRIATAAGTLVIKPNGKAKSVVVYQGQTSKAKGTLTLLTDTVLIENQPADDHQRFGSYRLVGGVLTILLVEYDPASDTFVTELQKLTKIK